MWLKYWWVDIPQYKGEESKRRRSFFWFGGSVLHTVGLVFLCLSWHPSNIPPRHFFTSYVHSLVDVELPVRLEANCLLKEYVSLLLWPSHARIVSASWLVVACTPMVEMAEVYQVCLSCPLFSVQAVSFSFFNVIC